MDQSEKKTQPLVDINCIFNEDELSHTEEVWGILRWIGDNNSYPPYELKRTFKAGRSEICDCDLTKMLPDKLKHNISRLHFEVYLQDNNVFIEDYSTCGTYLNGNLIEKEVLNDNDVISILKEELKIFEYIDKNFLSKKFRTNFCVHQNLGFGAYGNVRLLKHKQNCSQFAIKKIEIEELSDEKEINRVVNEINNLQTINHPFIVKLIDYDRTPQAFFIVTEYVESGDLNKYLKGRSISEDKAKYLFGQLVEGTQYLHEKHKIIHRDLKPDNILVKVTGNYEIIKIADFGFSKRLQIKSTASSNVGTPWYTAPEILEGSPHREPVDLWSLGIILHYMLVKDTPFSCRDTSKELEVIKNNIGMVTDALTRFSNDVKDLIEKILVVAQDKRITLTQIKTHPWMIDVQQKVEDLCKLVDGEQVEWNDLSALSI